MATWVTFAVSALFSVFVVLSFRARRRALHQGEAMAAGLIRERDDARTRAERAEAEAARMSGVVRGLVARLDVATRSAETSLSEAREAEIERRERAHRLTSAAEEVSVSATEAAGLSSESAAVYAQGTEAVERMAAATRDLDRSFRKVGELSERAGTTTDDCRDRLARARGASARLVERTRELVRRAEELPGVAERLMSNGEVVRFAVSDFEKEASGIMGVVLQGGHEVEEVGKRAEEIGSILEFMTTVAEETNLLALNASIIAAEAGAEGRGFAVVAEEIRELSERMASSTREISSLVDLVKSGVADASEVMRRGGDRSAGARKLAQRASSSLDALLREADTAARLVRSAPNAADHREDPDPVTALAGVEEQLHEVGGVRVEIHAEKERIEPVLGAMQKAAESVGVVVAESARTNAEITTRLAHMKELALPMRRIGEEHAACEETCRQSGARLERALSELRARIAELDGLLSPGEAPGAERSRPAATSAAAAGMTYEAPRGRAESAPPLVGAS